MNPNKLLKEQAKEQERIANERNARCVPVAKEALRFIVEADLSLSDKTHEEMLKEYSPVVEKVLQKMLDVNLPTADINYIKQIMLEPIEKMCNLLFGSIDATLKEAAKRKWGKPEADLTLGEIDEFLKATNKS